LSFCVISTSSELSNNKPTSWSRGKRKSEMDKLFEGIDDEGTEGVSNT
jgi:hypothetical protein